MRRAPIRVRLTAWYVLALALALAALGTFVVTRLRTDLVSELDRELMAGASQIGPGYRREGVPEFRDVTQTVLPGPRNQGSGAQILGPSGRVLVSDGDPDLSAPLLDRAVLAPVRRGEPLVTSRRIGSPPRDQRVVAVAVRRHGRTEILAVTASLREVDEAVREVVTLLLAGGAAALGLVAAGGWLLARAALRPVERMTTRADSIGIHDLGERIAVPHVHDEVGHLARTLNAMLDRLQSGVAAREGLVADASHELRTPLAAMRAEIEVSLGQDPLGREARAVLESASEEVVRMSRIVEDLLTLARSDVGRLELHVASHELRALATRTVRARARAAHAAAIRVAIKGEPVTVRGDGDRLQQVIGNLLDNAIRLAPAGSRVRLELWANGREGGIAVADEGPGIMPDARERVFERFGREDPARTRGGAGLGLAICREIVHAHGGRIWVEESPSGGARFVVALPQRVRPDVSPGYAARSD